MRPAYRGRGLARRLLDHLHVRAAATLDGRGVSLAPRLRALPWAVGGSVLLRRLGLDVRPNDLDLVTTVERFDEVAAVLADALGPGDRPAHDTHRSHRFLRFSLGQGPCVDLMAGVRAHEGSSVDEWHHDPATVTHLGGVPWSSAEDWVTLYSLLGRTERAEALRRHLLGRR